MTHQVALVAALWMGTASALSAHEFNLGDLFVDHPHIPVPADGATTAVGLLEIHNRTSDTEQLTEVRGPGVTLMHRVEVGDAMRMVPVDRLAIPRGKTLAFSQDALHVVFEIDAPLSHGDLVPTTFVFENAGEMDVIFVVETPGTKHADH